MTEDIITSLWNLRYVLGMLVVFLVKTWVIERWLTGEDEQ